MSTSIETVIEHGGYDLSTVEDARWLVAQVETFEELVTKAEDLIEADENKECEHENTSTETVENTAEYEYNQGIGNTSFPLRTETITSCDDCGEIIENE